MDSRTPVVTGVWDWRILNLLIAQWSVVLNLSSSTPPPPLRRQYKWINPNGSNLPVLSLHRGEGGGRGTRVCWRDEPRKEKECFNWKLKDGQPYYIARIILIIAINIRIAHCAQLCQLFMIQWVVSDRPWFRRSRTRSLLVPCRKINCFKFLLMGQSNWKELYL